MRLRPGCVALACIVGMACAVGANWAMAGDAIKSAGDALEYALPVSAAGATLFHEDRDGFVQFLEAGALTLGTTYALQYGVEEKRPDGGGESFPSAHASISFWSAEFMRKRYGWEYGVPAYAAASFVAYSRVESREHHPQDVIAGAAIGIISSYIFTKPFHGWEVQPTSTPAACGVSLVRRW